MTDQLAEPAEKSLFPEQVQETATPAASPTENKESPTSQDEQGKTDVSTDDTVETDVEKVPDDLKDTGHLHKDSRFNRVIRERNELREERMRLLEEKAKFYQEKATPAQAAKTERPAWFTKYFGDDEEAWNGMTALAQEKALAQIQAKEEQQQTVQEQSNQWVDDQIDMLDGDFDRNLLMAIMDKYHPTNAHGDLDFQLGLEMYREKYPDQAKEKAEARKKVASSLNVQPGKTEPSQPTYATRASLRKAGGWDGILDN